MTGVRIEIGRKLYPAAGNAPARLVFADFRLAIEAGSFVCLLGASGIGKTTLLNTVAGLDRDFSGRIAFGGPGQPRIGYAFQNPRLLPWRTVLENLLVVLTRPAPRAQALALLAEVGLADAADVYPERLSLGMQRRVALSRAFAVAPDLLLMDEPFTSLDEATAERLRELLLALIEARPATVLFVTHDSREAVRLADRIVVLAGSPARIAQDLPVGLRRNERRDDRAVEAFRARHLLGPAAPAGAAADRSGGALGFG